jgi:non-specific serine/threonine protein kinase/serine/threonine-protein kinase
LKPSNILVALQDGHPVPKIIDFGVAKATGKRLTEHTLFTELGMIIGTPEYMSPEQAESTGLDVDTRTDVYALGVMLYELMSGALPFEPRELRAAGYEELRRRIREVDPPRPSTRVARLGPDSTEIARARRIEPRRLVSRLRGDLDWIAMKCLEKDRTRRYGSPAELAADLRRHLENEPVLAGPPSTAYRARKFVRRHRIGVATVSLAALALAVFAISTAAQARRIAAERDRADREAEVSRRVTEFMTNLFRVSDPSESRGNTVTAREILDRGAEQIGTELSAEPEVQARLMLTMGNVYASLGLWRTAEPLDEKALALCRSVLGPEHPETLRAQYGLAMARFDLDRYEDARELLERTADVQRRTLGAEHAETLETLGSLATALVRLEHYDEAKQMYLGVLAVQRRTLGNEHRQTLITLNNLGSLHLREEEWEDAERYLREAADTGSRALGEDHPETLNALANLAWVLRGSGRLQESEELYRRVIAGRERVYGLESPQAVNTMMNLATVLSHEQRYDEAEALFLKVIDFRRRQPGGLETSPSLTAMIQLGVAYMAMRRFDDGQRMLSEAHQIAKRKLSPHHKLIYLSAFNLACLETNRGRRADALHWLRVAVTNGFWNTDRIRDDPDLQALHDDPEFERALALAPGYEAPAAQVATP